MLFYFTEDCATDANANKLQMLNPNSKFIAHKHTQNDVSLTLNLIPLEVPVVQNLSPVWNVELRDNRVSCSLLKHSAQGKM